MINEEGSVHQTHTMFYGENDLWKCEVDYFSKSISYQYQLVDERGNSSEKNLFRIILIFRTIIKNL
jgi:hypothetical protein